MDLAIVDVLRERLIEDEPVDAVDITASTPRIKAAYRLADAYRARGSKSSSADTTRPRCRARKVEAPGNPSPVLGMRPSFSGQRRRAVGT